MALGRCSKSGVPTRSLRMTQLPWSSPCTKSSTPSATGLRILYALWFVSYPVIQSPSKFLTFQKLCFEVTELENFCFKQSQTPDRSSPRRDPSNKNIIFIENLRDLQLFFGHICLFSLKKAGLKLISFRQRLNLNIIKYITLKHSFFLFKFL